MKLHPTSNRRPQVSAWSLLHSNNISKLVFCALALLLCGTTARATTYFVDGPGGDGPGGSNSYDGLSVNTAWATISMANSTLVAGDTVEIRGGDYTNEQILPVNSGTSASLSITYRNHLDENVTLNGGPESQADISNRNWIVLSGLNFTGARGVKAHTSSHCTVEDCTFTSTTALVRRYEEIDIRNGSSYITVRNCLFDQTASSGADGYNAAADGILVYDSSYVLIDSCEFGYSRHYGVNFGGTSHHAIVRNCIGQNPWHANMGAIGRATVNPTQLTHIVIEDNYALDAGLEESSNPGDPATELTGANNNFALQGVDCIIRRNIFDTSDEPNDARLGRGMVIASYNFDVTGNRIYNNIISNNPIGSFMSVGSASHSLQGNIWKNNIFYQNILNDVLLDSASDPGSQLNSLFTNNDFYNSSGVVNSKYRGYTGTYAQMEAPDKFPTEWLNNLGIDPLFVDATGLDYSLQAGSPMIDAGDHLTFATGSGTNSSLVTVADAKYFCDGFGLVAGDMVQIGGSAPVRITAVNYTTNQITLASPVTWSSGASVSLPYSGNKPDIGVYEFTTVFDANALTIAGSSGDTVTTMTDPNTSNGNFIRFDANADGDYLTFTVNVPATQTYRIEVKFNNNNKRGIYQLAINNGDGTGFVNQGGARDLYSSTVTYPTFDFGTKALTAGARQFRFTVTGMNGSSYGRWLGVDTITLGDLTQPTVSINAPASGATVSATIPVAATAFDNFGVVGVQFKRDAINLGPEDTKLPYTVNWNTTGTNNGPHTLTAIARDAAGNTKTSAGIPVTVNNPPSVFDANALSVSDSSGDAQVTVPDTLASNGNFVRYDADAAVPVADFITFDVNVPVTMTYLIEVKFNKNNIRGTYQLAVNNGGGFVNIGTPQDLYSSSPSFASINYGGLALTAGVRQFKFTVTGKAGASNGFGLGIDTIKLIP